MLVQVGSIYPNLDLSNVTMDDPLSTTPADADTVNKETEDSTLANQGFKDDGVVLAQSALERPVIPFVKDPFKDADNPFAQDAQNSLAKDDENPPMHDAPSA